MVRHRLMTVLIVTFWTYYDLREAYMLLIILLKVNIIADNRRNVEMIWRIDGLWVCVKIIQWGTWYEYRITLFLCIAGEEFVVDWLPILWASVPNLLFPKYSFYSLQCNCRSTIWYNHGHSPYLDNCVILLQCQYLMQPSQQFLSMYHAYCVIYQWLDY